MRRFITLIVLAYSLLLSACASVGPADVETVEHTERRRFAAMSAQDIATLEPMLADELQYGHSNGEVETKPQFLETIRTGRIRYESIDVHAMSVRQYRDIGIAMGSLTIQARAGGQPATLELRYTDAYVWRDGRWQLITWQSTRLPPK